MGNLQPVARADKNGKVVIRHVRSYPANDSLSTQPDTRFAREQKRVDKNKEFEKIHTVMKHREHITRSLTNKGVGFWRRWRLMRTLHPDTIPVLLDHNIRGSNLDKMPMDIINYCEKAGTFSPLNDLAAYLEDGGKQLLIKDPSRRLGGYDTLTYLLGLSDVKEGNPIPPHLAFTPYSKAPQEERAVQRAIVEATHELGGDFVYRERSGTPYPRTMSSYPLLDYIRNNPERSEQVVKIIKDRRITPDGIGDIASMIEMMDEVTNPLLDGTL